MPKIKTLTAFKFLDVGDVFTITGRYNSKHYTKISETEGRAVRGKKECCAMYPLKGVGVVKSERVMREMAGESEHSTAPTQSECALERVAEGIKTHAIITTLTARSGVGISLL